MIDNSRLLDAIHEQLPKLKLNMDFHYNPKTRNQLYYAFTLKSVQSIEADENETILTLKDRFKLAIKLITKKFYDETADMQNIHIVAMANPTSIAHQMFFPTNLHSAVNSLMDAIVHHPNGIVNRRCEFALIIMMDKNES